MKLWLKRTFTPQGIAGALKKIAALPAGSRIDRSNAAQASHMFFGSISRQISFLFATHPPLDDRIRAIEPSWDGRLAVINDSPDVGAAGADSTADMFPGQAAQLTGAAIPDATRVAPESVDRFVSQAGNTNEASLEYAQTFQQQDPLNDAAREPFSAICLVYAMLMADSTENIRQAQLRLIDDFCGSAGCELTMRLQALLGDRDHRDNLSYLDLAMPALKTMSRDQYLKFMHTVLRLVTSDRRVMIFEWVLHRVLVKHLRPHFEGPQHLHGRIRGVGASPQAARSAAKLLAILASTGNSDFDAQLAAYKAGTAQLEVHEPFAKQEVFDFERINDALEVLRKLKPLAKPRLLKACIHTVEHDGVLRADEYALVQGIAATLDCPLPPVMGDA